MSRNPENLTFVLVCVSSMEKETPEVTIKYGELLSYSLYYTVHWKKRLNYLLLMLKKNTFGSACLKDTWVFIDIFWFVLFFFRTKEGYWRKKITLGLKASARFNDKNYNKLFFCSMSYINNMSMMVFVCVLNQEISSNSAMPNQ